MEKPSEFQKQELDLANRKKELSAALQNFLPDANMSYYKMTNEMHCNKKTSGGSKFENVSDIFAVLQKGEDRILAGVKDRVDDRELFMAMGVEETAFLPVLPANEKDRAALYYKIDGILGKLGLVQLRDLDLNKKIIIRREKSFIGEDGKEKVPCSFSVVLESEQEMPQVDFATVIIGREDGGSDELWTVHPGAPIRSAQSDIVPGSESLAGPKEGEKQEVILISVADLLDKYDFQASDFVKIVLGKEDEILQNYTIKE